MNKKFAESYLKLIGRPILGLQNLQLITEKEIVKLLSSSKYELKIERTSRYRFLIRQKKIQGLLPKLLRNIIIVDILNYSYELIVKKVIKLSTIWRVEKNIDLWIEKV